MSSEFDKLCRDLNVCQNPEFEVFTIPGNGRGKLQIMINNVPVETDIWYSSMWSDNMVMKVGQEPQACVVPFTGRLFAKIYKLFSSEFPYDMIVHYYHDGALGREDGCPTVISIERPRLTWTKGEKHHNPYGPSEYYVEEIATFDKNNPIKHNIKTSYHIDGKAFTKEEFESHHLMTHLSLYKGMTKEEFLNLHKAEVQAAFSSPPRYSKQ